jgi:hypothetical protein
MSAGFLELVENETRFWFNFKIYGTCLFICEHFCAWLTYLWVLWLVDLPDTKCC